MQNLYLLFLEDSREVELYSDLRRLLEGVESPDVRDGMYDVYDSKGVHFVLFVDDDERPRARRENRDTSSAQQKIVDFYGIENPRFASSLPLDRLIKELLEMYGLRDG